MMFKRFLIVPILLLLISASSLAAMPKTLNYQGKLIDVTTKVPVTAATQVNFLIYDSSTGGSSLWNEEQVVTPDANGVFSAIIGNTTPINVDISKQLWLAVEAPTGPSNALWPRRQLTAAPYALYAGTAESLVDSAPAGGWVDDGTVVRLATATDKVGIGTVSPNASLDIAGSGGAWHSWNKSIEIPIASVVKWEQNAGGQRFAIGSTTGGFFIIRAVDDNVSSTPNYPLTISDHSTVEINGLLHVKGGPSYIGPSETWASGTSKTYYHNLGYIPYCMLVMSTAGNIAAHITSVDTTSVTISVYNTGGNSTSGQVLCW